MNWKGLGRKLF